MVRPSSRSLETLDDYPGAHESKPAADTRPDIGPSAVDDLQADFDGGADRIT